MNRTVAWLLIAASLTGCGTVGSAVDVTSQATSSSYFSLSRPAVYKTPTGLELAGRVCRRARTTLLSPPSVRLDHVAASGDLLDTAQASVGAIYRNADQACTHYAARVSWTVAQGDSLRACFNRGHACPADPAAKTVVSLPTPPARAAP